MKKNIFMLAIAGSLISCGNDKKEMPAETTPAIEQTAPEATAPVETSVTVELNGNDQMQYDKNEIKVKAGQKVTLTLKNIGTVKKELMAHNFVLLNPGTDVQKFALDGVPMKDKDYISDATAVIVHTKMLGPGEADTITFDAPAAGTYDYVCTFPGHFGVMKGKLIVE